MELVLQGQRVNEAHKPQTTLPTAGYLVPTTGTGTTSAALPEMTFIEIAPGAAHFHFK